MQQLPHPREPCRRRLHAGRLGDRDANDDQPGRKHTGRSAPDIYGVLKQELSGKGQARRRGGGRTNEGFGAGVDGAHAGVATTRSVGGGRRVALVHRPDGQRARQAGPEDRPVQGIPAQDAALRPARTRRGQGRQHLVHGEHRRAGRQTRSENRRGHRISDARSGSQGPAHADFRFKRNPLVHGAERQPDRAARPEKRRDQAAHTTHREIAAVRHGSELERHRILRRVRHQPGRQRRP